MVFSTRRARGWRSLVAALACASVAVLAGTAAEAPPSTSQPPAAAKAVAPSTPAPAGPQAQAKSPAVQPAEKKPAATATAKPAPAATGKPPEPRISDGQKDFCHLVRGCNIPYPPEFCPDGAFKDKAKVTYDSARCLEARLFHSRGVTPGHPYIGYKLFRFLGLEYRVIYNVESEIPISEARLAYLLGDLPLSARLVSHFRKEPYTAAYSDDSKRHFTGTKGKRLKGEATLVSGNTDEKRLFYFGSGTTTVAFWTLKGPALMDFAYAAKAENAKAVRYKMKILVFPGNGIVNGIMNLGMFRKIVLGKIKEVLVDITDSARQLAAGGEKSILASKDWTAEEKRKIEEFLKLP